MIFTKSQVGKLSELFLDIAKAMFIAAFSLPVISPAISLLISLKMLVTGTFCIYLVLKLVEIEEVIK